MPVLFAFMSLTIPARPLLALLLATLLAGGVLQAAAEDAPPATFTINVSGTGFDPPVCRISRRDRVTWKNTGNLPIRVIWPDPNGPTPLYDSGTLKPGEISLPFSGFEFPGNYAFRDAANSSHVGLVILPTFTNTVQPECTPSVAAPPPVLPRGPILPLLAADR